MTEITLISFILNMAYLVVALFVVWGMLKVFDRLGGGGFNAVKDDMFENPIAIAVYYGARFIAVCLLGAAFIGG